jgi:C-terminal region of peptidase_M24
MLVEEHIKPSKHSIGEFLRFKPLTLVPYCSKLIHKDMLNRTHINAIEAYYRRIEKEIFKRLEDA